MIGNIPLKDHWAEKRLFLSRAIAATVVILALAVLVALRLTHLQVVEHQHFADLSQGNRIRLEPIPPIRGLIFDRNGNILAQNLPAYQLELTREEVPDLEQTLERLLGLGLLEAEDLDSINARLRSKRKFEAVPLRYQLSDEEVARFAVQRQDFPGVDVRARLIRSYPYGADAVNAVGYVGAISEQDANRIDASAYAGTSHIGKLGIEKQYEDLLHGRVGYRQSVVNAEGRTLQTLVEELPSPGRNLTLSLDIDLQLAANAALEGWRGAVVGIDVRDGGVRILTSTPSFDPNQFAAGISQKDYNNLQNDPDKPLFNRALRGQYPPGSTIKPILGLAGMAMLGKDPKEQHFCPGYFMLPGQTHRYRDWKKVGHGRIDLVESVAQSCDIYYYQLAVDLGIDRMHEIMTAFGIGRLTGIDVPGEKPGLMPSRDWKKRAFRRRADQVWFPGETVITGIGQGYMLATPLQLAYSTAIVAAKGARFRPHLLAAYNDPVTGEETVLDPDPLSHLEYGDDYSWQKVHESMIAVMHGPTGTARRSADDATYRFAGKTGTAQVFSIGQEEEYDAEEVEERLRHHALFVAFAPAENPELALGIIVENGGGGSSTAAPLARLIFDQYFANRND